MRAGVDPLTGDRVGGSEKFSLLVQGLMRKWTFVLAYTAVTVLWWTHPHWFGDQPTDGHWQDAASYGALLIESVVGIGMFSWARRDSVILRKVHAIEQATEALLHRLEQADENNAVVLDRVLRLLESRDGSNGAE